MSAAMPGLLAPGGAPGVAPTDGSLPGSADLWTRLFGGANTTSAGTLSPDDVRAARNAALFKTGLSILANSGPAPYRRSLGEIVANGLLSGQQGYQDESQRILAAKGTAMQQAQLARMADIAQKYSGRTLDAGTLQNLMSDLASNGESGPATAVAQYLESMNGGAAGRGMPVKAINHPGAPGYTASLPDNSPVTHIVDPSNPSQILATYPAADEMSPYQSGMADDRRVNQMQRERDAFIHRNDYTKEAQSYDLAKSASAEAAAGNPEAYKSAILGFAAVADPRAQIRLGVLNYVQKLDPSFKGTFEQALDKITSGTLPPDFIQGMNNLLDRIHQTNAAKYMQARNAELRRHSSWRDYGDYLPQPEEIFGAGVNPSAGSPGGGPGSLNSIMGGGQ